MKTKTIYVEIPIQSKMNELWDATQQPHMHEQWDLRFSSITYKPRQENEPQLFTYETKIGFGLKIAGWGKSVGNFNGEDGSRTSSLHFGTDQAISIIREGRGYWKYKPNGNVINFSTQYDYDVNFGKIGKVFDYFIFRPLIGWATALSFDVVKRWLEQGELPKSQYIRFFCSWMTTLLFFFVWLYHGLVPKITHTHAEELIMLQNLISINDDPAKLITILIGLAEITFGIILLFYRKKRKLFLLQMLAFPFLAGAAIIGNSNYLLHPFNPLTFNIALFVLSIIGYVLYKDIPSARTCKRKR